MRNCSPAWLFGVLLAAWIVPAGARERGRVGGGEGPAPVHAEAGGKGAVIAEVPIEGRVEFEAVAGGGWWKVRLPSGHEGWMHHARIRLHHELDEIPEKGEEGSEVAAYGKMRGFDYHQTAHGAAQGKEQAMLRFFAIVDTDGAASETHAWYLQAIVHILGDEKLAAFLKSRDLDYRLGLRNQLGSVALYPFEPGDYLKRHFPKTSPLLFQREVTDWTSPDGRFVIRKVFSTDWPGHDSRVESATVLERSSGRVLADFTAEDPGEGIFREGRILWAPDAQRFATFSGGLAGSAKTVVFQFQEGRFHPLEQPEVKLPEQRDDSEIQAGTREWSHIQPERWEGPVLVLQRHDYFVVRNSNGSIHYLGRTWELRWNTSDHTIMAKRRVW